MSIIAIDDIRAQKTAEIVAIAVLLVVAATAFVTVSGWSPDSTDQSQRTTVGNTSTEVQTDDTRVTTTLSPTPTVTATPVPTATPTPTTTPSPTPTATPTPKPYDDDKYDEFVTSLYAEANADAEVRLRIRGYTIKNRELIIVMNLSAPPNSLRLQQVNTLATSGYAQAVANHDRGYINGKIPSRLRIAEVNNTGYPSKTLYVNTSLAREYYTGQIDGIEFADQYWETQRNMTAGEKRSVQKINRGTGNITLYNESAG